MKKEWDALVAAVEKDIPGFRVGYKSEDDFQKFIASISVWNDYASFTTTIYPIVWFSTRKSVNDRPPIETLQHEWVHLKDYSTFFGWLPFLPASVNSKLFSVAYLFPQILAVLALFFPLSPVFLVFLVFALPWPAPFRAYAEARAYRRSAELGYRKELALECFGGSDYYWMLPFKPLVEKWLEGPSPYKEFMDTATKTSSPPEA